MPRATCPYHLHLWLHRQAKRTMIEHGGFANLLKAKRAVYELSPEDRVLQFASMNFDASLSEIAAALEAGATLCMANKMEMLGKPA